MAFITKKAATNKFVAEVCRQSYYQFFLEHWPLIAAEKLVPSWYIKKQCDELQVITERVFEDKPKEYDLIWNCPPGTSKSSVVSVLWQPWIWTRMPSARFISGSYSERLALDLSRKSRDVVLSEKYQSLFPEIVLSEDQNTKGYFVNTKGGIRYAVGVGGTVIGFHAHFQAIDDPIDPQGAFSDLDIANVNNWIFETLSRRKVNAMLTPTVMIMQRLAQNDPTGAWLERKRLRVKHFCLPCDDSWEIKPPELKEFYQEGLLDPIRLPRIALEEAFDTLLEYGYASQMGQQPTPRGGAMFKVDKLSYRFLEEAPKIWKRGPIRFWDKAGTRKGGAFTVGAKMAEDLNGYVWILDVIRDQWNSGKREEMILETAKEDGKRTRTGCEQEPGAAGKQSAEETVHNLGLIGRRGFAAVASGDKELRADLFSQSVNSGKVILVKAPWNHEYVEEMRFFPRSRYKDQIDASSGAYAGLRRPKRKIGVLT